MLREGDLIPVYQETIRPLYAYVSRRVGGERALAEDLVQETWMRAPDAWGRHGIPDSPLAWLAGCGAQPRGKPLPAGSPATYRRRGNRYRGRQVFLVSTRSLAEATLKLRTLETELAKVQLDLAVIRDRLQQLQQAR